MIKVEKLTKEFDRNRSDFEAVKDVSFTVEDGGFAGFIGHSGSGKTTLFNMLAGFTRPTAGRIYVDGEEITSKTDKELAEYRNKKIGYILQGKSMLNNLSLIDNICLPAYMSGDRRPVYTEAVKLLEEVGLEELSQEYPGNLSGGELRRAAVARAMINNPAIILADEPTSNLDPENSAKVMELLQKVNQRGTTVLVSTHELEYLEYTDCVYKMQKGEIQNQIF